MKSLCAKINWLKWFNRLLIFFFLFLLLFLTNFHALSWNDSSRFATIQNLVENKSFIINNAYYERGTHDKVFINGFYYSDKPPLFSVIGSFPYFLLHAGGIEFNDYHNIVVYTINVSIIIIPFLVFFFILYKYICNYTELQKEKSILLTNALAVGTSLFAFSAAFNNHQPAAILIGLSALYLFFKERYNLAELFLIAFALSLATFIDLGAIFIAIPFSVFVLLRLLGDKKKKFKKIIKQLLFYMIGAAIPLIVHCYINQRITGDLLPAGLHSELFQYTNSPWVDINLLTGVSLAVKSFKEWLSYIWVLTFGHRGFFVHNPLFFFGLILAVYYIIKKKGKKRLYAATSLFSFVALFIYYSLFGKHAGGVCYSVRWFVISIPLVFPLVIDWIDKNNRWRLSTVTAFCLILSILNISAAGNVLSTVNGGQGYNFTNTTVNFPNYLKSQYTNWNTFLKNIKELSITTN